MFDLHVHTHHSCDASPTMAEMAEEALRRGLEGIAFSDHMEWVPEDEATGYLKPDLYFAELEATRARYGDQLEILAGLEVGNSHQYLSEARDFLKAWPWDYVLGSAHWADGLPMWQSVAFEDGMEVAYARYFREVAALAAEGEYDVLAHFDLVVRDSWALYQRTCPTEGYAADIREALRAVVERGKGLEVNTSPMSKGLSEPSPSLMILRWYRELGGEILTFGSDAHRSPEVGQHFERARELALAAGFERLARFRERRQVGWTSLR
ncbi:MAG: histidinol-phosphatase [Anaerolineae bacterium]